MSDMVAVEFDRVSKLFALNKTFRSRSFQESLISMFRNRERSRRFWGLHDVSFSLEKGRMYGFIGPNGAGKSTALKLIARTLEPTSGSVKVNGQVGALLELGAGFHPDLSGRENILLNGALLGLDRSYLLARLDEIVSFAELEEFIDAPVKHYSSGMYVRLGFSIAVHTNPEILLVDEVLAVGDARFQHKCLQRITQMQRSGVTIVLVSHDVSSVESLCDEVLWFDQGELVAHGPPRDVILAYLRKLAHRENVRAGDSEPGEGDLPGPITSDHRWGSRRVEIVGVELRNGGGEPSSVFFTGKPMDITIHYLARERVEDPVFGLAVHHQNGVHVCGPNTHFGGQHIPYVEGQGSVTYAIPALPLLEGDYLVSVAVHEKSDLEMYDYHDRLYPFRVYPGATLERYGLVNLGGEWVVRGASE